MATVFRSTSIDLKQIDDDGPYMAENTTPTNEIKSEPALIIPKVIDDEGPYVPEHSTTLTCEVKSESGSNVDHIEELDSASNICIAIDDEQPYEPEYSAALTCKVKSEGSIGSNARFAHDGGSLDVATLAASSPISVPSFEVNFLDTGNEEMDCVKYENSMTIQSLLSDVFKSLYFNGICEPNFYKLESVRISDPNTPFSTDCQIINIVGNPASIFDFVFASRIYNFEATSSISNEKPSTSYEIHQLRTTLAFTREQSTSNWNSFSRLNDPKASPRRRSPGNPRSRYNRSSKHDISSRNRRRCSRSRVDYSATRGGGPYGHQHSESPRGRVSRSPRSRSPSRSPQRSPRGRSPSRSS
ncbi:hypothetical protein Ddc_24575 [Ditylenchus destructor]|nr:hypothetical protein Ddc_24575 [Ditylenchus destructor]